MPLVRLSHNTHRDLRMNNDDGVLQELISDMEEKQWTVSHLQALVWLSCPPHRAVLEGGTPLSRSSHSFITEPTPSHKHNNMQGEFTHYFSSFISVP